HYINPLLLVLVALGMGVYTSALAASLDGWLADQIRYRVGADLTFQPLPPLLPDQALALPPDAVFVPPMDDFVRLPGVLAATRVGNYRARLLLSGGERQVRLLALDRANFARVAWFRPDFADESLGGLMNLLALAPENVLVPRAFLAENSFQVGDRLNLRIASTDYFSYVGNFRIAGLYDALAGVTPSPIV
ncbi:MAG TPA: hypothetical protein PKE45_10815, partial [Caldilineaceae bacterium]|nr:hypothetical protein [Caldilineaceae bacterium]